MMFLVFDIGCIECGEDSKPVGLFTDRAEAEAVKVAYESNDGDRTNWGRPEWGGQHRVEIFEMELSAVLT